LKQSTFPKQAVLPHIELARRAPLRAAGLFTAVGLASAEDWGFSAMVEPHGLSAASQGTQTRIQRGAATYPLCIDPDGSLPCRQVLE